jgi:hypothetical protein
MRIVSAILAIALLCVGVGFAGFIISELMVNKLPWHGYLIIIPIVLILYAVIIGGVFYLLSEATKN